MKIFYQDKEIGLKEGLDRVSDIFLHSLNGSGKHIMACKCNNEVKPLWYQIQDGDEVELLDLTDRDGLRVYIRGVLYVMSMAFDELYPGTKMVINYQLKNSMFCELMNSEITSDMVKKIEKRMREIVKKDMPIIKREMSKQDAVKFYETHQSRRGDLQLQNKLKNSVSLYFCGEYYNYFYGVMPMSTGYIDIFK